MALGSMAVLGTHTYMPLLGMFSAITPSGSASDEGPLSRTSVTVPWVVGLHVTSKGLPAGTRAVGWILVFGALSHCPFSIVLHLQFKPGSLMGLPDGFAPTGLV